MGREEGGFRFERVMLIDDDSTDNYINQRIISGSLFSKNIITMSAAEMALTYLIENLNNPSRLPEFIFLDLNLPEMNGLEFLDRYAELNESTRKHCKIIVLTNALNPE